MNEEEQLALMIRRAKAEEEAAKERGDKDAARYARTAIGLLRGSQHETNQENKRRMICASMTCVQACRLLLWGDEKVKVEDVN